MGLDEVILPTDTQIGIAGTWSDWAESSAMPTIADALLSLGLFPKQRVALIDKDGLSMALDVSVQLGFGLDDALKVAKAFQMRFSDVGDEAIVWVGDLAEEIDFARVVGSHLHNGNLGLGLDAQQGERHTDMVIEVAHSVDDVVFLRKHCRDKLFGGRFAVGTSDAEHCSLALLAVIGSQVLQGLQRVIHNQNALVFWKVFAVGDDEASYSLLGHLQGEVVSIEVLAFQGEEDSVFFDLAAVS